jgi:nucleoside-diphosphate-sugar epimerase
VKILLTGATGFIGKAFLAHALAAGHEVGALIRPESSALEKNPRVRWLTGTLSAGPCPEIADFSPEACVHTAWLTTPGIYLESPENELFLNWSRAFLRQAMEGGTSYVVTLGTCIEYAASTAPLSERSTRLEPVSTYAKAKDKLRRWQEDETSAREIDGAWARVFYPYGPGEHPSRLATSVAQKVRRGEKVSLMTADSIKDYIFISDLAAALLAVVENRLTGAVNLGTGHGVSVGAMANEIASQLDRPDLIETSTPTKPDPFAHVVADASRLRSLGWRPQISLAEGVRQVINHLPA